ncbi:MAG: PaaI family thioesterase [Actinomycetota bacterium]
MSEDNPLPAGVASERAVDMANQAMHGTLMERMGIEWLEVGSARLVARMPVAGNAQVYGLLHGGATATLCETVGSFGTAVAVGLDRRVVGIPLSVNHLRAVGEGHVTCTASRCGSGGGWPSGTFGSGTTGRTWWPRRP